MLQSGTKVRQQRALTALLVVETFILFLGLPLASRGSAIPLLGASLCGAVVTLGLVILSPGTTSKLLATLSVAMGAGGAAFRLRHPSVASFWLGHGAVLLAVIAISLVIGRVVFRPGRVTHHRIQGAVILYLNIAVAFTSAYRLIEELSPGAFANFNDRQSELAAASNMLYFSFTCLTSTGFGDIIPVHPLARSLANLEAVMGQLYLATLLARLVSLHVTTEPD